MADAIFMVRISLRIVTIVELLLSIRYNNLNYFIMKPQQPHENEDSAIGEQLTYLHTKHEQTFVNSWDIEPSGISPVDPKTPSRVNSGITKKHSLLRRWFLLTLVSIPISLLIGFCAWLVLRQPITENSSSQLSQRANL